VAEDIQGEADANPDPVNMTACRAVQRMNSAVTDSGLQKETHNIMATRAITPGERLSAHDLSQKHAQQCKRLQTTTRRP